MKAERFPEVPNLPPSLVPKSVSVSGTQGPPFTPLPRPRPPEIGPVQAGAAVKHAGP